MSSIKKYLEEKAYKSKMAEGDKKDDGMGVDEIDTDDYTLDKNGKKHKAHKIVFNKGEDDGKQIGEELKGKQHKLDKNKNGKVDAHDFKLLRKEESVEEAMTDAQMNKREDLVKGMKKNFKSFVDKYGKDRAENVMYATATKNAMKEETITESADYHEKMADQHANHANQHEKESTNDGHPDHDYASVAHADAEKAHNAAAAAHKKHGADSSEYKKASQVAASATSNAKSESDGLRFRKVSKPKAIKESSESWYKDQEAKAEREARAAVGPKDSSTVDKIRAMMAKEKEKKASMKEGWDDMMKASKALAQGVDSKKSTKTYHDVKKTSTGTVYTKQFDKDGTSKGTGDDAAKKAVGAEKRGRGRPKKDKFAEAVEFLMDLTEEQFDSVVEEGFDSFVESFLDEGKTGYAPGWMIKADPELKKKIDANKAKQKAMRQALGNPAAGKSTPANK